MVTTGGRLKTGAAARIMELSFPRTFVPGSESSIGGTFVPWNFRSLELSFLGRERKRRGTFAPGSESNVELSLPNIIYVLTCRNLALYFFYLIAR